MLLTQPLLTWAPWLKCSQSFLNNLFLQLASPLQNYPRELLAVGG